MGFVPPVKISLGSPAPKLGIPVEMLVSFPLCKKLLLKQRFLAVHHDFH